MNGSLKSIGSRIEKFIGFIDRNSLIYLSILFGINIFIKLLYAGDRYYWLDETSSIFSALHQIPWMIRESLNYPNPPLYFILLKGWISLFGMSEFSTRAFSVLASALTVFVLYYIARRFFNRDTAVYVTLFFTVSQIHLYFSHETRGYTIIALLATLSYFFYLRTISGPSVLNLIAYTLINTLLLYIHPVPAILIIIQFICLLLFIRSNLRGSLYVVSGQIITGILFGFWILKNQWFSEMRSWIPPPDPDKLKELLVIYLNSEFIYYLSVLLLVSFIVLTVVRFIQKKSIPEETRSFLLILLWGLLPILVIYFISQFSSRFVPRYMLFATPGLYLLIAYMISRLPVNYLFRVLLMILILISSLKSFNLNPIKGEDWPGAISFMKDYRDDSTLTIISADYQFMSFSYYYDTEIFKKLEDSRRILKDENIYFTKGAEIFDILEISRFNQIIIILSHETAADPEGTLFKYLSDRYPLTYTAPYLENIKAYVFDMDLQPRHTLTFDFEKEVRFNKLGEKSGRAYSGNHVSRINKDTIYSKGLTDTLSQMADIYSHYFTISIRSLTDSLSAAANLVCSFEKKDSIYFWNAVKIQFSESPGTWSETNWTLNIAHVPDPADIIKIYAYNLGDDEILFDDLVIVFYK